MGTSSLGFLVDEARFDDLPFILGRIGEGAPQARQEPRQAEVGFFA